MGKAQIAMEYVAIVGIVLLVLSGTLYLFISYARSSKEQMTGTQLNVIAEDVLNTAEEMYYLGEASKKVITVDMPKSINKFGLVVSTTTPESYLLFEIFSETGTKTVMFESDVKLKCPTTLPDPLASVCTQNNHIPPNGMHDSCGSGFDCYEFAPQDYSAGIKHFKIETKNSGGIYVDIDEVSHELS